MTRGGLFLALRERMGPSVPERVEAGGNALSDAARASIVKEVVAELDNEYPPMDSSFDYVTARRAASMAVDKTLIAIEVTQPDNRGEA